MFTDYLKRIGAYLPSRPACDGSIRQPQSFPVEASVIIPVRTAGHHRRGSQSALSQETDFPFNVIVVDNHSTDGTTAILADLAKPIPPETPHPVRTDLGIGGCWNEALRTGPAAAMRVQLDSDDLYSSGRTLQRMVDMLRQGSYAMVVGSYTLVNFEARGDSTGSYRPPGMDRRERSQQCAAHQRAWGPPRIRHRLMRNIGFLNVSYGEDYAAALRICREYRIGRIYESLYLCRRWSGNTDAALGIEAANRNDAFKDDIRTAEITARQEMNQHNET